MAAVLEGYITIRNLRLTLPLGLDAWGRRGKPQPVLVNVKLRHEDIQPAAESDDCSKTISYSDVAKAAIQAHETVPETAATAIADAHFKLALASHSWGCATEMVVETVMPKGALRIGGGYALKSTIDTAGMTVKESIDILKDLCLACIIGVNPHEREQKQTVVVNMQLWRSLGENFNFQRIILELMQEVIEIVEQSSFETVESLALALSHHTGSQVIWTKAVIQVEKPSAIALADGCGVELHCNYTDVSEKSAAEG